MHAEVSSAHRTPEKTKALTPHARANGVRVLIAGAVAAALYAIVQIPKGIPVATLAINGAANATILALEILSIENGADGWGGSTRNLDDLPSGDENHGTGKENALIGWPRIKAGKFV